MTLGGRILGAGLAGLMVLGAWAAMAAAGARPETRETQASLTFTPAALYALKCSGCHSPSGAGAPASGIPPFPGFIGPLARRDEGRLYITHVPGVRAANLADAELAAVLNYVMAEWAGTDAEPPEPFTAEEVARLRAVEIENVVAYRRTLVATMAAEGDPVADYPWP